MNLKSLVNYFFKTNDKYIHLMSKDNAEMGMETFGARSVIASKSFPHIIYKIKGYTNEVALWDKKTLMSRLCSFLNLK